MAEMNPGNSPENESPQVEDEQRQRKAVLWQQLRNEFLQMADGLGHGIDEGILETVVGLNALGITTRQSCEGHADWSTGAPWVDLTAVGAEVEELDAKAAKAWDEADNAEANATSENELDQVYEAAHRARREAEAKHFEVYQRAMDVLTDFYSNRSVAYDTQLILAHGARRIESHGASFQELNEPLKKQEKLLEYQREMHAFTAFLKDKFFADDTPVDTAQKALNTLEQQSIRLASQEE